MKNLQLKVGLIAAFVSLLCLAAIGQGDMITSDNIDYLRAQKEMQSPTSEYVIVSGNVINSDVKKDRVGIELYQLDEETCKWQLIEKTTANEYLFTLERTGEYQIWFHGESMSKILYIDPGYSGPYQYRIDANFNTSNCARLTPDGSNFYKVKVIPYRTMTALIYSQEDKE